MPEEEAGFAEHIAASGFVAADMHMVENTQAERVDKVGAVAAQLEEA